MNRRLRPLLLRIGMGFLVAFLVSIPAGYAFLEYSTQPEFCTNCHIMEPYVQSWRESSHRNVPCVDCHYEPGILETMDGKLKALNQVAKYVTGTEGTKPWAEVSDASCMRSGCHSTRLLAGEVKFDLEGISIPFDHTPHLLEMRRGKKLRCTSCHSQIVQGEHVSVTPSTCFLCHFKGAEEDPKLSSCSTCHGPPERPIELGDFTFEHARYVERGVGCDSCHASVTQGTGEVPRRRCGSCHGVVEHLERYGETEFLHRKHVTDHKVDCLECHTEITHRLEGRQARPLEEAAAHPRGEVGDCAKCHDASHSVSARFYRGQGGLAVPESPSAMFLARVDCSGCHLSHPGIAPTPGGAVGAREVACLSCHGPEFEGMMGRWQAAYAAALEAVEAEVGAAREALAKAGDAPHGDLRKSLADAAHDAALVRRDGSRGVHNPWYARRLLESAHGAAARALRAVDPERTSPPLPLGPRFATKMTCATLCHLGVEERRIGLPGTAFDHGRHLGKVDCDACHSTGAFGQSGAEHGRTLASARDCLSCHHAADGPAPGAGRECASCHAAEDRFARGIGADGEETGLAMMAEIPCDACHGDPPVRPVREQVRGACVECHEESYGGMMDEWIADAAKWRREAEARLAPLRAPARSRGGAAARALEAADTVLARLRLARPAHNVLLFEQEKEAFDEAASALEGALR